MERRKFTREFKLEAVRLITERGVSYVFGERHLRYLLNSYQSYYNEVRTHLSLHKDAPIPRETHRLGRILSVPILGGLHHQYLRI
jgi:hypothetical protein